MSSPLFPDRQPRSADCVSDYQLDKLVGNIVSDEQARALRAHIAGCIECSARLQSVEADQRAFAERPVPMPLGRAPSRSRRRWLYGAASASGALAIAAVALLMLRPPAPSDDATRIKGTDRIGFSIVDANRRVIGDETQAVAHPGDELHWDVRVTSPKYVAVLSRDAAGAASVYFPEGERAVLMNPGVEAESATKLDAVLGRETLYTLFCKGPVSLEPLRRELQLRGTIARPEGCEMKLLFLRKDR